MPAATVPVGAGIRVEVPASSANLGPGFDSIGLALGLWDSYDVLVGGDRLVVEVTGEGAADVPRDGSHLVHRCLADGLAHLGVALPTGLRLVCRNGVPHSRGLGSSATAIVAGYAAATALADLARGGDGRLDLETVNQLAAAREGHPDNSSASVHGGLTVSWSEAAPAVTPVQTACLELHPAVTPVVLVPGTRLATATARAALPAQVPLQDAALGAGRAALLVEALTRRPELLLPATRDWLHQEQRRGAYPSSMALVDSLRAAGHAAAISGAGPTVLVLATEDRIEQVRATDLPDGWVALTPGVPRTGARVIPVEP